MLKSAVIFFNFRRTILRNSLLLFFVLSSFKLDAQFFNFQIQLRPDSSLVLQQHFNECRIYDDTTQLLYLRYSDNGQLLEERHLGMIWRDSYYYSEYDREGHEIFSLSTSFGGDTLNYTRWEYDKFGKLAVTTDYNPGMFELFYYGEATGKLSNKISIDSIFYSPSGLMLGKKKYWDSSHYIETHSTYLKNGNRVDSSYYSVPDYMRVYLSVEVFDSLKRKIYQVMKMNEPYLPDKCESDSFFYAQNNLIRYVHCKLTDGKNGDCYSYQYYYKDGRLIKEGNIETPGSIKEYTYDKEGHLTSKTDYFDANSYVKTIYKYSKNGLLLQEITNWSSGSRMRQKYKYNKQGKLIKYRLARNSHISEQIEIYYDHSGLANKCIIHSESGKKTLQISYTNY